MNYDERISIIHKNIISKFQDMINEIKQVMNNCEQLSNQQESISYKVNDNQINTILDKIKDIKAVIADFNYYTEFYPNKNQIWKNELSSVDEIINYINSLETLNNKRNPEHDKI